MSFRFSLRFLLLFATAAPLPAVRAVTIDTLVEEALAGHPELKFYEAEIAAMQGKRRQSGVPANPELSAELGHLRVTDLSGNSLGDGAIWSVSVAQTFEFPGRVSLRKAVAGQQVEIARLGFEQFRMALANHVRLLGYRAMAAERKADAATEVAGRFQSLLEVLLQRDPAGVAPILDTRIIEATALTLGRRATVVARERQAAFHELNQLRGKPISSPIELTHTPVSLTPLPELVRLLTSARERNFGFRSRIAELEQQGFSVQLAENERWPSVTLRPYIAGQKANDRQQWFGLGVSIPLPLWDRNNGNIEAAKARRLQAEVMVTVALRELERQIAQVSFSYRTQVEEMRRWTGDSIPRFQEAAALGDKHYRLGALPVATYTELQSQYLDALDALLDTELDALESRIELESLTGLHFADLGERAADASRRQP